MRTAKRLISIARCTRVTRDVREEFVDRVKAIDPIFKRGDLEAFWPSLRVLIAMSPDRADLSKKKSHYLTSLAARSLARGSPDAALEFLDYADRTLDSSHLTAFLLNERSEFRREAEKMLMGNRSHRP